MRLILIPITFLILVLITGISATQSSASSVPLEIPTIDYCELIRNPSLYDQKVVRVRATYVRGGTQTSNLYNFECDYHGSTWVEFNPTYESCTKRKEVKRLVRMERDSLPYSKPHTSIVIITYLRAEVVFVGKFEAALPEKVGEQINLPDFKSDSFLSTVKTDYAHYFHYKHLLTVNCVEKVTPVPPRTPW